MPPVPSALATALLGAALALGAAAAQAEPLHVVSSGGLGAATDRLAAEFAQRSGQEVDTARGPSMGGTHNAIPQRLARHEPVDVVLGVSEALDALMAQGLLAAGSKVELADSTIACAVRHGAPHPDMGSVDGVRNALLAAHSVAWSDSASGRYIDREMIPRLGIVQQMQGKGRAIPAVPVGEVVARGEAEFGCQQRSELLPIAGIDIVGDLPAPLQRVTAFSVAIVAGSAREAQARAFIEFLRTPHAAEVIRATGLEPRAGR
ncbi:substrate-binding domain-containing protein [Ramlibacter aquaticus]|uniref:Substrate-binding domain-containing protein n=2 Tax=Comamonadaceae TaxID=80864 RepID=A0ABR9SFN5_9BURK|nr:substrate-binding domain-containing protein [Ramlibacter aquaticus]